MAETTGIQWTDATWNPLAGCKEVSPGCTNCYAAVMAHRLQAMGQTKYAGTTRKTSSGKTIWTGKINLDTAALQIPMKRRQPTRYFVNSMSDLFHEDVPDDFIDRVFAAMALAPQHVFQVLTKRPKRMLDYIAANRMGHIEGLAKRTLREQSGNSLKPVLVGKTLVGTWPWPHVWLGVSCEDQQRADERIPILLETPAAVRFLSCEPLLGPIDLQAITIGGYDCDCLSKSCDSSLSWAIVGGESGPGARHCGKAWIRSLVQQCQAAGVPVFVKQMGSNSTYKNLKDRKGGDPAEWDEDLRVREFPYQRTASRRSTSP